MSDKELSETIAMLETSAATGVSKHSVKTEDLLKMLRELKSLRERLPRKMGNPFYDSIEKVPVP